MGERASARGCRRVRWPRLLPTLAAVLAGALALAAGGGATGGATIADAPSLPPAATMIGNTSSDPVSTIGLNLGPGPACPGDGEFWSLSLIAGDQVTLKGTALPPAAQMFVDIFPPGTTDADVAATKPLLSDPLVSVELTAASTGTYPVLI